VAGRGFSHLPTSAERVAQMIDDDETFLKAHPTRTKKSDRHKRQRRSDRKRP
jgi:hypothetical protein